VVATPYPAARKIGVPPLCIYLQEGRRTSGAWGRTQLLRINCPQKVRSFIDSEKVIENINTFFEYSRIRWLQKREEGWELARQCLWSSGKAWRCSEHAAGSIPGRRCHGRYYFWHYLQFLGFPGVPGPRGKARYGPEMQILAPNCGSWMTHPVWDMFSLIIDYFFNGTLVLIHSSGIPTRGTCTEFSQRVPSMTRSPSALRNPKERLPSGVLKEEFGWMIFEK